MKPPTTIIGHDFDMNRRFENAGHTIQQCLIDVADCFKRFTHLTPWCAYRRRFWRSLLITILSVVSGGQLVAVVNDIVEYEYNGSKLIDQLPAVNKYKNVIGKIKDYNQTLKHLNRWKSLQYVVPDFSERELKGYGFNCGERSIKRTKELLVAHNGISMQSIKQNRDYQTTKPHLIEKIHEHYHRKSRPSPNIVLKKLTEERGIPVTKRYMVCSYRRAYDTFPYRQDVSESTFYRYRPPEYAPPKRVSDRCSYCMEYHFINQQLHRLDKRIRCLSEDEEKKEEEEQEENGELVEDVDGVEEEKYDPFAERHGTLDEDELQRKLELIDESESKNEMTSNEAAIWRSRIEAYRLLVRQRLTNELTQQEFDRQLANLTDHQLLFLFDYKQNLIVGHCPEEEHWKFRHLSQRTALGIFVYSRTHCYKVDVISNLLAHTSIMTKQMMRHVVAQPQIRELLLSDSITSIVMWADNGNHFHSNKFLYFPLVELLMDLSFNLQLVAMNFFVPYHGKNPCDQHFSKLSYWVTSYSLEWPKGIDKTEGIIKAITDGTAVADRNRNKKRKNRSKRKQVTLPINCDKLVLPEHIRDPLVNPQRMECTLTVPNVKTMTSIEATRVKENKNTYVAWRGDGKYWMEMNGRKQLVRHHASSKSMYNAMVKQIGTTKYRMTLAVKPYPYSPPELRKVVKATIRVEPVPKQKDAPDKEPKKYTASKLAKTFNKRDKIFGGNRLDEMVSGDETGNEMDESSSECPEPMNMGNDTDYSEEIECDDSDEECNGNLDTVQRVEPSTAAHIGPSDIDVNMDSNHNRRRSTRSGRYNGTYNRAGWDE